MALSTNTQTNSNGVVNYAIGKVVTDGGAAAATTFTLGFVPRKVRFVNLTDRITDEWFEGMSAANSLHTVAAGTVTLETTNGITVSGNTFTVTATTMVASKSFFWEAFA
jgi:phosphatidylserine synthase